MSGTWILVWMLTTTEGVASISSGSQEFGTEESCQMAAVRLVEMGSQLRILSSTDCVMSAMPAQQPNRGL